MQEYAARVFWNDDAARERCPWIERWNDECDVASRRYKKRLDVAQYQKAWMEEAGFVDVREVVYKVCLSSFLFFLSFFSWKPPYAFTTLDFVLFLFSRLSFRAVFWVLSSSYIRRAPSKLLHNPSPLPFPGHTLIHLLFPPR